ncbi:hypothetical protein [Nocardioides sp. SYSU DS0663]|uniref:hypothetical protein n=1 Tax=Nocardioides sp. SYSU DS0663 TaxID=3416445 RepID=UPI003F4C5E6B
MRARRLLTATLAATLLAPAGALTATPATAAEATRIVGASGEPWLEPSSYRTQPGAPKFNDSVSLQINVETTSGERVFNGGLTVQRKLAGKSGWVTVASSDSAYLYETIKAKGNATYRVLYAGDETYAPTEDSAGLKVQRDLGTKPVERSGKLLIEGKVKPGYKKKKVVVQRKNGKKWTKFSVVRTNAKSAFTARVKAPARVGGKIHYRVVVPAGGGFATSTSPTYIATKRAY